MNDYDIDHDYTNNRLTSTHLTPLYDADGRQTQVKEMSDTLQTTYDGTGRPTFFHRDLAPAGESEITRHYDGDGREVKREERNYVETAPDTWQWVNEGNHYYIRSTVLGGEVVSRAGSGGEKRRTFVRAAGAEIAWQNKSGSNEEVIFRNWDASGSSYVTANSSGTLYSNYGSEGGPAELDPMGGNVGTENRWRRPQSQKKSIGSSLVELIDFLLARLAIPISSFASFYQRVV